MLVVALSAGLSTPVRATPSTEGSGTISFTGTTFTVIKQAAGNTFIDHRFTEIWTGILAGSCSGAERLVFHADGSGRGSGSITCTGTAAEQAGTFNIVIVAIVAANGSVQGHFVVGGVGALANLHGQGTAQASPTATAISYTVGLHFDL